MSNSGLYNFAQTYQISPIFMSGGIAGSVPGGTVPLLNYLQSGIFPSLIGPGAPLDPNQFFAQFDPLPGGKLTSYAVGEYPFANQSVAANAYISEPLTISLMMICPRRQPGDYSQVQSIMTALKQTMDAHILSGGTFSVATPVYLYANALLLGITDASAGETIQRQYRFQWDFRIPLVSSQAAQQAYNNLMAKVNSQTQFNPDNSPTPWSTLTATTGNPNSGASTAVVPSSSTQPTAGFSTGMVQPSAVEQSTFVEVNQAPATISATPAAPTLGEAVVTPATLGIPVTGGM